MRQRATSGGVTTLLLLLALLAALPARAGLTHYWTWRRTPEPDALQRCAAEQRRLFTPLPQGLRLDSPAPLAEGEGPGTLGPPLIALSAIEEPGNEPFVWPGRLGFNFCKTASKPYDALVTALLIAARDCFTPDLLAIGSDADWADWSAGAALYQRTFEHEARNPFGGTPAAPPVDEAGRAGAGQGPRPPQPVRVGARGLSLLALGVLLAFIALYRWDRRRPRPLD